MSQIPTQHVSDILRAVTDPFSLLALIVLVLGWIGYSSIKSTQSRSKNPAPWPPLIALSIIAVSFVALGFNVIRVTSLRKPDQQTQSGDKYTLQITLTGVRRHTEPATIQFRTSSGQLNVGCGDSASTSVSWSIPLGAREIHPQAMWANTDNVKSQSQQASVQGNMAVASGAISGQDRQWTGNCPGGGHGELVLSGTYVIDQATPDERVDIATLQGTVSAGGEVRFDIKPIDGATLTTCEIRATHTATNTWSLVSLKVRDDGNEIMITAPPDTPNAPIKARFEGRQLVVKVP